MTKDISIAIVVYQNYSEARKAVNSIEKAASSELSKEIFLIDNSEPRTDEARKQAREMEEFLKQYPDTHYLSTNANLGFSKGQNLVLDQLDSRYHAIVNPDVLLYEDSFSKIIDFMEDNPDIGMVIPKIVDENGLLQYVYRHEPTIPDMFIRMFLPNYFKKRQSHHTLREQDYTKPFQVPFGQGSFLVIRTPLYRQLNGFDEKYFLYMEDADLCRRVNEVSSLYYFPDTAVYHRWEKGSHKNLRLFSIHVASMIQYFHKWGLGPSDKNK